MGHFKINEQDVFFILKDQLHFSNLCKLERYRGLDGDTLEMVVSEAIKFARQVVDPLQKIGEKWGVVFEEGHVRCAPEFRDAFRLYGENGWTAAARNPRYGGQGLPHMIRIVVNDFMYGAAYAFNMLPSLTHGAAHLIETFATEELRDRFVRKMYGGQWSGTMCLTEPNAGSYLADIRTMAFPEGEHFRIKGTKIFISWGEHDLTENIVHLVLARMQGAPEGVKGLSLFIVPKIRVLPDGSLGEPNDVICAGVERKLGLHASPTCVLCFGDNDGCIGYLCGEKNRGLSHMFQMMNAARINAGICGMSLGSTAYQNALAYTKVRIQGADVAGRKRKSESVPIINHPDVRRMLLWMKAVTDGMRSMVYTAALWSDLALEMPEGKEKRHYQSLTEFITPIVKAYCSDMGFRVCETAIQCLGGYGFCQEYHLEQYLRDVKIASLYEGTNGIQSIDLMSRKVEMDNKAPYRAFMKELGKFCTKYGDHPALGIEVQFLAKVRTRLAAVAAEMSQRAQSDPLQWASYTYPALLCFGDTMLTWRLLHMAVIARRFLAERKNNDYWLGKVMQATYFARVMLPTTTARLDTCVSEGREIVKMPQGSF